MGNEARLQILIDIVSRLAGMDEAIVKGAQINAMGEQGVARARQELAIEEQQRAIAAARFDLVASEIASDGARVNLLRDELKIRTATLGALRAEELSQAGLNTAIEAQNTLLAVSAIRAEEAAAASALSGVNLNKARSSAGALAQELLSGKVTAQNLGTILASFGNIITIAGIAGYALHEAIAHAADEALRLARESEKETAELTKQVQKWNELARAADDFSDSIKLGQNIDLELAKLGAKLNEFRAKELTLWQRFSDQVTRLFGSAIPGHGPQYNRAALDAAAASTQLDLDLALKAGNAAFDSAQRTAEEWKKFKTLPPSEGIDFYTQKIDALQTKMASLEQSRRGSPAAFEEYVKAGNEIIVLQKHVDELTRAEQKGDRRGALQETNALLREQQSLIESIRQQEQLIDANSFLGADARQAATLALVRQEMAALAAEIEADKAKLAGGTLDPATYARVEAEVQKLQFQFDLLGLRMQSLQLPLQAELANWVTSFGTSAHQLGQVIEGTINASLQGTNQLLLDSLFRTGDWQQTLIGVERQVGNVFLTWAEQEALQFLASQLHITTNAATQTAANATIAASAAPAAAAQTGASYGTNWIIGGVVAAAAIAAILAALGAFEEGGYTGGRRRKAAGIVHGEEYVFDAESVDAHGVESLDALRRGDAGIVHLAEGARVEARAGSAPTYRIMSYGPGVGEHTNSTNFGPFGRLRPGDVAISPNLLSQYPLGSHIMINGRVYRVADYSYFSPGKPTTNTVEIWSPPGGGNTDQGRATVTRVGGRPTQVVAPRGPSRSSTLADANNSAELPEPDDSSAPPVPNPVGPVTLRDEDPRGTLLGSNRPSAGVYGPFPITGGAGSFGILPIDGSRPLPIFPNIGVQMPAYVPGTDNGGFGPPTTVYGSGDEGRTRGVVVSAPYGAPFTDYGPSVVGSLPTTALGYGVPIPASGDWIYGGVDAPVGAIVGSRSGRPVYQGAGRTVSFNRGGSNPYASTGNATQAEFQARRAADLAVMSSQSFGGQTNRYVTPDMRGAYLDPIEGGSSFLNTLVAGRETQALSSSTLRVLLSGKQPRHAADGVRLPGGPSMIDTIPAMLAAGELVMSAPTVAHWDAQAPGLLDALMNKQFDVPGLHLAEGGRVDEALGAIVPSGPVFNAGEIAASANQSSAKPPKFILVYDLKSAIAEKINSSDHDARIVEVFDKHRRR